MDHVLSLIGRLGGGLMEGMSFVVERLRDQVGDLGAAVAVVVVIPLAIGVLVVMWPGRD